MAESFAEEYSRRIAEEQDATAIAPLQGGLDLRGNTFDAFSVGVADTATFGLRDEIAAAVRTMPGADYSSRYMAKLEEESARGDELARQNPGASITGSLLGAIGGGGLAGLGVKSLLKTTAKGKKIFNSTSEYIKYIFSIFSS